MLLKLNGGTEDGSNAFGCLILGTERKPQAQQELPVSSRPQLAAVGHSRIESVTLDYGRPPSANIDKNPL